MAEILRVGSRASRLALAQTESVAARLRLAWPDLEVRVVPIRTAGDRDRATPLAAVPREAGVSAGAYSAEAAASAAKAGCCAGVFVKDLEESLLAGRIDLAVHSMKDVPTRLPEGLEVEASVPARADVRDCLVTPGGAGLEDLDAGARVGTSSPRRRAMTGVLRPDVVFVTLRGNVETRLRKLEAGECDAAVLARAGLERLSLLDRRARTLPTSEMLPAAGQGALGLEFRAGDERVRTLAAAADDPASRAAVVAERALVRRLGAGCHTPLGVLGTADGSGRLALEAWLLSATGERSVRRRAEGDARRPADLGVRLAEEVLERGGRDLLAAGRGTPDA
jgi:hydroxymethylbilane synthase